MPGFIGNIILNRDTWIMSVAAEISWRRERKLSFADLHILFYVLYTDIPHKN